MKGNWKENDKEKTLFKTVYCLDCKQVKICGKLNSGYSCCQCFYKNQQGRDKEYSNYEKTLATQYQI